jgi:uncharacterized protein DUF4265
LETPKLSDPRSTMSVEVVVMAQDRVKVTIQVRDDDGEVYPREWLWAEAVTEDDDGGTYCLLNTPLFAPFALGDMVDATRQDDGTLAVTALHRRGGRTAHLIVFSGLTDRAAVQSLADEWAATGTWVESCDVVALTVAVESAEGGRPTGAELAALRLSGSVVEVMRLADPEETPDDPIFRHLFVAA